MIFRTRFVKLPDIHIAYHEHGTGQICLLLHGNSQSKRIFRRYQQEFFSDFQTIAIDSRGHGESKSIDYDYAIRQFSRDIVAFCDERSIERAVVIGYSDGANIALFLAHSDPKRFPLIAAISPNYLVSGSTPGSLLFLKTIYRIFLILNFFGIPTGKLVQRFDLMLTDIGLSAENLREIESKIAILYAERDMNTEAHMLEMATLIPNAQSFRIDGTNHLSILNNTKTIAVIRRFFRSE